MSISQNIILLTGPTATGKTALAVELAHRLNGEILSADSMQIYRGLPIGTAQPTQQECRGIPYHLVGVVEPQSGWTAAEWLRAAWATIREMDSRGKRAIVTGGTGLYFKIFTDGLFDIPAGENIEQLRTELEDEWAKGNAAALRRELEEVDPAAADRIHPHDQVRTVRALEVYRATGRAITDWQQEFRARHVPPPAVRFVLTAGRARLYEQINQRVDSMMERGFIEEVRALREQGADATWPAMRALGYPQMLDALQENISMETARLEMQKLSRRYAKQQMVLFRNWPGAIWLDAEKPLGEKARFIEKTLEFFPVCAI